MTFFIGKDKFFEFGLSLLSGVFSVEWIKKYVNLFLSFRFLLKGKIKLIFYMFNMKG